MPRAGRPMTLVRHALLALAPLAAACAEPARDKGRHSAREPARDDVAPRVAPDSAFRARLGVTWELARLGDQELPPSPPSTAAPGRHPGPGTRPTIRFTADSAGALADRPELRAAGGWSFCNGYGAAYALGPGDSLRFRSFQSTLVGCGGPDSLEARFFRALGATRSFELDASSLTLVGADGSRLRFVVAAGPPRP